MKKIVVIFFLTGILTIPLLCQSRGIYIALSLGWHWKDDVYHNLVYDRAAINYTADAGYRLGRTISLGVKLTGLSQKGETTLWAEETELRQTSLLAYLKAGVGKRFRGYVSLGVGYLFYKEESYIDRVDESLLGWEVEAGTEFFLSRHLFLVLALRHLSFRKEFVELSETQQLGGSEVRLGLGYLF